MTDHLSQSGARLSEDEQAEMDALNAKVSKRDPATGQYPHWTQAERDRRRELARKRDPALQFAPSTDEMARRFGHHSQRGDS